MAKEREGEPEVDNDPEELQYVDVEAVGGEGIRRFHVRVNELHGKAEADKVGTHYLPHDRVMGGPAANSAVRCIRFVDVSGYTG